MRVRRLFLVTASRINVTAFQALDACEALKEEEKRRTGALEDAIFGLREAQSTRDMRRAESALRPTPRPQGPLQMTGAGAAASVEDVKLSGRGYGDMYHVL